MINGETSQQVNTGMTTYFKKGSGMLAVEGLSTSLRGQGQEKNRPRAAGDHRFHHRDADRQP